MITPTEFSSRLNASPWTPLGKLDHLAGHHAREAVDPGDAVADLEHAADLADVDPGLELLDFMLDNGSDLVGFESHGHSCRSSAGDAVAVGGDRAVVDGVADADDDPADQLRIDGAAEHGLAAEQGADAADDLRRPRRRPPRRRKSPRRGPGLASCRRARGPGGGWPGGNPSGRGGRRP